MAFTDVYRDQVELLVQTLPHVAEEECFALKGGTAINLFIRDMPRVSVDIDLTYLPLADRNQALTDIEAALRRIADRIKSADPSVTVTESTPASQKTINKLVIATQKLVRTKIEVTPVLRGCVYDPQAMSVRQKVEEQFGFAEMQVLSFADLYGGKVMAALDRQHPRDLFDVHLLLEDEGLTDDLRTALIVYLISHDHPPQGLLSAGCRNIAQDYEQNFYGMTEDDIPIATLYAAHRDLLRDVVQNMPAAHKEFLPGFYRRKPDWSLFGLEGVDQLPSVRWREINLDKAGEGTREEIAQAVEKILGWY